MTESAEPDRHQPVKTSSQPEDRILLEGPAFAPPRGAAHLQRRQGFHRRVPRVSLLRPVRHGVRLGAHPRRTSVLPARHRDGESAGAPRIHGDDRRRSRTDGGREPRRARSRRPLGRRQHRAAVRAGAEPLLRSHRHVPVFLRAQGAAVQVLVRVRRAARRSGHARRAERSAHADSDEEDSALSGRADGGDLLARDFWRCSRTW